MKWLLTTALWLSLLTLPVAAVTPSEYDQALGRVQAALLNRIQAMRVEEVPTGEPPSLAAQQALEPIHSVERPGSAPLPVQTAPLISAIAAAETVSDPNGKATALKAVEQQIVVLRAELAAPGGSDRAMPDPVATVRSARAVLAGEDFASDPLPPQSLAEKFAAWLDRVFTLPSPKTPNSSFNGPNVNPNIILGIFIAIAVAAFAVLVTVMVQAIGRQSARAKPLALDEEEANLVEARDNDSLLALAEQQAKSGDYRRAFRLVYLAALVALDSGGVLRFDRSKTNWEYLRALRGAGRGDVYQAMTPLTREFDQIWYGFARTDASHYARALAQYQALLAAPQGTAGI